MPEKIERPDFPNHPNEKLGAAVEVLATHPGDVKLRLKAAAHHLALVPRAGLPDRLRREFESIWHELTKRPNKKAPELSPLSATLHRMRLETAAKLAQRVF